MNHYKILMLGLLFVFVGPAYAQNPVVRGVGEGLLRSGSQDIAQKAIYSIEADAWRSSLSRSTIENYMLSDQHLLQEMYLGNERSVVGGKEHMEYNKWRNRTGFLGDDLSKKITKMFAQSHPSYEQFPAYYKSFPSVWQKEIAPLHGLGSFEVILEAAYGDHALFEAHFVPSLKAVFNLMEEPIVNGVSAAKCLENGIQEGLKVKSGFFAISVMGPKETPSDVLLLDLSNKSFISLKKTQSALWQQEARRVSVDPHFDKIKGIELGMFDHRETSGVILSMNSMKKMRQFLNGHVISFRSQRRPAGKTCPLDSYFSVMISTDGKNWAVFSMDSQEGKQIYKAFSMGYYIYFEPKPKAPYWAFDRTPEGILFYEPSEYTLSFASKKGRPLYSDLKLVEMDK